MLQQAFLHIPGAGKLTAKAIGRSFSLFFLRPLQYFLEVLFYFYGIGFLVVFSLEFYSSAALESLSLVVLLRGMTDPLLTPLREGLGELGSIPADAYRVLPLALSILTWLVRPVVVTILKRQRLRLEGLAPESLFAPRHLVDVEPESEWSFGPPGEERAAASDGASSVPNQPVVAGAQPSPVVSSAKGAVQLLGRRYELMQELGRGAVGAVYKALDLQIGRTVALKVIIPDGLSPEQLRPQRERLYREARTAGKMIHPGIVTILDLGQDALGNPYIVMEFAEGGRLDQALHRKKAEEPLDFAQRLEIAIELAQALDYAHRRGVVHRDIKPSNVLLTADGHAKIADFGIAKPIDGEAAEVPGTPAFVSPELLTGSPANARSDLFSLGVVLYWMFTGEIPFSGDTVTEIVHKVAHANPRPVRQVNWALPAELDEVLRRCLAKDPSDRYPSAGELAADLVALRDGRLQRAFRQKSALSPAFDGVL